jgi:hypothetical protein
MIDKILFNPLGRHCVRSRWFASGFPIQLQEVPRMQQYGFQCGDFTLRGAGDE